MTNVVIPAVTSADTAQPNTETGDNGDINLDRDTNSATASRGRACGCDMIAISAVGWGMKNIWLEGRGSILDE